MQTCLLYTSKRTTRTKTRIKSRITTRNRNLIRTVSRLRKKKRITIASPQTNLLVTAVIIPTVTIISRAILTAGYSSTQQSIMKKSVIVSRCGLWTFRRGMSQFMRIVQYVIYILARRSWCSFS